MLPDQRGSRFALSLVGGTEVAESTTVVEVHPPRGGEAVRIGVEAKELHGGRLLAQQEGHDQRGVLAGPKVSQALGTTCQHRFFNDAMRALVRGYLQHSLLLTYRVCAGCDDGFGTISRKNQKHRLH
ncbi:hypothetical protein CA54_21930 [Symmachiella macrocystis]|uniref:Uncharacterized protein n=1 Tax=Symmachiella macrocystis TaxID=2527985 RepID=A0A5C6BMR4_9PLAN|nr:hypothetical protein CA54_21930 [Symmachiella macrocystis]